MHEYECDSPQTRKPLFLQKFLTLKMGKRKQEIAVKTENEPKKRKDQVEDEEEEQGFVIDLLKNTSGGWMTRRTDL